MTTRARLILLAVLWLVLAISVGQQLHHFGWILFYPVLIAWLGGIVSYILVTEAASLYNSRK